jgi:hypothetical protein
MAVNLRLAFVFVLVVNCFIWSQSKFGHLRESSLLLRHSNLARRRVLDNGQLSHVGFLEKENEVRAHIRAVTWRLPHDGRVSVFARRAWTFGRVFTSLPFPPLTGAPVSTAQFSDRRAMRSCQQCMSSVGYLSLNTIPPFLLLRFPFRSSTHLHRPSRLACLHLFDPRNICVRLLLPQSRHPRPSSRVG